MFYLISLPDIVPVGFLIWWTFSKLAKTIFTIKFRALKGIVRYSAWTLISFCISFDGQRYEKVYNSSSQDIVI